MNDFLIMGILNITPDSFSDGGKYNTVELALSHVDSMLNDGADIIDIGAESTRPGAITISAKEELDRLIPVLEAIKSQFPQAKISIDTSKAEVMAEVVKYDVWMINDVTALNDHKSVDIIKNNKTNICLMHMQKNPMTMQVNPKYNDVTEEIFNFFTKKINYCLQNGINKEKIFIDPGFGFGKTLEHNKLILKNLATFTKLEVPILVGLSRKSMIGDILNKPINERLYGSVAAAVIAYTNGARIIRTHDVKESLDALKVTAAVCSGTNN